MRRSTKTLPPGSMERCWDGRAGVHPPGRSCSRSSRHTGPDGQLPLLGEAMLSPHLARRKNMRPRTERPTKDQAEASQAEVDAWFEGAARRDPYLPSPSTMEACQPQEPSEPPQGQGQPWETSSTRARSLSQTRRKTSWVALLARPAPRRMRRPLAAWSKSYRCILGLLGYKCRR